jgi:hypothetical protein
MIELYFALAALASLIALLVCLAIAFFSPRNLPHAWMAVSVLSVVTLIFATIYVLLGYGWL